MQKKLTTRPVHEQFFAKTKNIILFLHDYKCFICGHRNFNNHVHHIDQDRTNVTFENLMPLCPKCHREVHKGVKVQMLFTSVFYIHYKHKFNNLLSDFNNQKL